MPKQETDIKTFPFTGGMNTALERVLIPHGGYSDVTNLRDRHPGKEQRKGQIKHHTTSSGSGVVTMYQFSKGDREERRLFRQNADGSLEQASDNPPGTTAGQYGSGVLTTVSDPIPASYSDLNDTLYYSDGARQHQVFGGTQNKIDKFIVYKGAESIPVIPTKGEDYTIQVTDSDTSTVAVLDNLGDLDNDFDAFFVLTPIKASGIVISIKKGNIARSDLQGHYWNGSWTLMSGFNDGTTGSAGVGVNSATLSASGTITWTEPTDEITKFQFGSNGYWYRFSLKADGALDSEVEFSKVTFNSKFQAVENVWDGVLINPAEVYNYTKSDTVYKNYAASAITMSDFKTEDYIYWNSAEKCDGIFLDVGSTPNTVSTHDKTSYKFDRNGDYLSVPDHTDWNFASSDFTIDLWARFNTISDHQCLVSASTDTSNYWELIYKNSSSRLVFRQVTASSEDISASCAWTGAAIKTWFHIAVVRTGNDFMIFVNGTQIGTTETDATAIGDFTDVLRIGQSGGPTSADFDGYVDEIRVSKGTARWTSNFTAPTTQYNPDSTTSLLIHGAEIKTGTTGSGATFTDSGNTGHTVTENGNAIEDTTTYPFGSTTVAIDLVEGWTGSDWTTATNLNDGTNGLNNTGFVVFDRISSIQKRQFQESQYYSYWYRFSVDEDLSNSVTVTLKTIPYYDINDLGYKGNVCAIWNERPVLNFDKFASYIYIGKKKKLNVFNGTDYNILETGDGRNNPIAAMKHYGKHLFVWQKEKGTEGGTTSYFSGTKPTDYTKTVLSTKIGALNAKAVDIVDGVKLHEGFFNDNTQEFARIAFWISQYGVMASNGADIKGISADIRNYFDSTKSEVIRRGYENEHWLKHDPTYNVLRMGLVSGSSATKPNIFFVYDLLNKTWSFDDLAQPLSCFTEIEAASGDIPVLSVGGGTRDGFTYQTNITDKDVDTAIDSQLIMELDIGGKYFNFRDVVLRMKVQTSGNVTMTIAKNGGTTFTNPLSKSGTFAMTAENSGEVYRRHERGINAEGHHLSVKLRNNTAGQPMYLEDIGLRLIPKHKRS